MKFTHTLRLAAAATALSATAFGAQAQALKLGHITPPTHVWHQVAEKIATDLDAASGGKMKIAVSPLQKLGNEAQMINLMQAGAQPFGIFTVGGLANREESFLGWSLPYVFKDVAHPSRAAGTPAAQEMLKRLDNVEKLPVKSKSGPGDILSKLPEKAPQAAENMEAIFRDFLDVIMPGITHWQSPNFFAYFPANSSYPSILAEMLTATLGAQCMKWETSPAAAASPAWTSCWRRPNCSPASASPTSRGSALPAKA